MYSKIIACPLVLLALLVSWAEAQEQQRVALLVGVEQYDKRGFSNLSYAEDDMQALAEALKQQGFQVHVLLGSGEDAAKATRANVMSAFEELFIPKLRQLNKTDIALVAFAGHGRHEAVSVNDVKAEDHFYCPCDAHDSNPETWISLSQLIRKIERESGCERNLILVDACRDNPSRGRGVDGKGFALNRDAVAVLFASSYNEQAYEPDDFKHGLFTYYVLEALAGSAKNFDNEVTWDSMVDYVKSRVESKSRELLALRTISGMQRPNAMGNLRGKSPVLARIAKPGALSNEEINKLYKEFGLIIAGGSSVTLEQKMAQVRSKVSGTSFPLVIAEKTANEDYNNIDAHETLYRLALQTDPDSQHTMLLNAARLRTRKQIAESAAVLRALIQKNPNLLEAHTQLVYVLSEGSEEDKQAAHKYAQQLIERYPDEYDVYNVRGTRLFNAEKYEEGLVYLEKAIKLAPDVAMLWNNKGYALNLLGRQDEADRAYERSAQIAWSRNATVLSWAARNFAEHDQDKATKYAKQATKLDPKVSGAWESLASVYYNQENYEKAIAILTEGLSHTQSLELLQARLVAYLKTNQIAKAERDLATMEKLANNDILRTGFGKLNILIKKEDWPAALQLTKELISEMRRRGNQEGDSSEIKSLRDLQTDLEQLVGGN